MHAEIAVPEKELGDLAAGQPAVFKTRADPDRRCETQVVALSPAVHEEGEPPASARMVYALAAVDNPDLRLRPGMTGRAKISCGRRSAFDLLTRRLARSVKVEFWSWW